MKSPTRRQSSIQIRSFVFFLDSGTRRSVRAITAAFLFCFFKKMINDSWIQPTNIWCVSAGVCVYDTCQYDVAHSTVSLVHSHSSAVNHIMLCEGTSHAKMVLTAALLTTTGPPSQPLGGSNTGLTSACCLPATLMNVNPSIHSTFCFCFRRLTWSRN